MQIPNTAAKKMVIDQCENCRTTGTIPGWEMVTTVKDATVRHQVCIDCQELRWLPPELGGPEVALWNSHIRQHVTAHRMWNGDSIAMKKHRPAAEEGFWEED